MKSTFTTAVIGAFLCAAVTASAEQQPAPDTDDTAEVDASEASSTALVPPAPGAFELSLSAGALSHETSYGKSNAGWLLGASAGWMPTRWLEIELLSDLSSRRESRGDNLGIRNTDAFVGAVPSFSLWFESLRFFAQLGGGTMIRSVSYDGRDLTGTTQVAPALYFGGGFGLVLFSRVGFTMRGAGRAYEDRLDALFTLDISIFIGS